MRNHAHDLIGRLRYEVLRPAVTTVGLCSHGCGATARGGGTCGWCLAHELGELITADKAAWLLMSLMQLKKATDEAEAAAEDLADD